MDDDQDSFEDNDEEDQNSKCTIRVENVKEGTDNQSIHYYFLNKKKSGGGPNKVEMDFAKKCALVTFDSPESKCFFKCLQHLKCHFVIRFIANVTAKMVILRLPYFGLISKPACVCLSKDVVSYIE